jgi:signal peptidase II
LRARVYIITALLLCTLDQLSKLAAERQLERFVPVPVIEGFFNLQLNYNKGIAFGLFSEKTRVFAVIALVMVIIITWLIRSSNRDQRLFRWALTFQLGGALGNLLDRALRVNGVVDFLDFGVVINDKAFTWPTFNLADVFVVIGTFFLVVYLIKAPPPELANNPKPKPKAEDEEPQDLEEVDFDIGMREGLEELEPLDEFEPDIRDIREPETGDDTVIST